MTIFVAGIHGVGKTFLCQFYSESSGVLHESSSALIRREKATAEWSVDKKAVDIDENQIALNRSVHRILKTGTRLLLDGHFVLIDAQENLISLDVSVFQQLGLSGVILIEASEALIAKRLSDRDASKSVVDVQRFLKAERQQAENICKALSVPLEILFEPTPNDFSIVINKIFNIGM